MASPTRDGELREQERLGSLLGELRIQVRQDIHAELGTQVEKLSSLIEHFSRNTVSQLLRPNSNLTEPLRTAANGRQSKSQGIWQERPGSGTGPIPPPLPPIPTKLPGVPELQDEDDSDAEPRGCSAVHFASDDSDADEQNVDAKSKAPLNSVIDEPVHRAEPVIGKEAHNTTSSPEAEDGVKMFATGFFEFDHTKTSGSRTSGSKDAVTPGDQTTHRPIGSRIPANHCEEHGAFHRLGSDGFSPKSLGQSGWTAKIRQAVLNPWFEYTVGVLLFMNAISIGIRAEHRAAHPHNSVPEVFATIELVFGVLFTLEVIIRICVFRCAFFTIPGYQWNIFDFIVVTLQDAEILLELCLQDDQSFKDLTFLRLLRLGRVVRLLRMVRLIPELKSMVYLIAASMQSFIWTMVLLSLLMYGVAVHLTEVVADYRKENPASAADHANLEDAWGSLFGSIVSLYQAILGGIDWKDLMDELHVMSWSVNLIFMMYVAFAALVMLNLVTGVFVEGASRIVAEDRDADLIRNAKKIFCRVDDSDDNEISWTEFVNHLEDPNMSDYFRILGISRKDAKDLFQLMDTDKSGLLTLKEFVNGCLHLRGTAKSLDLARLAHNAEAQGDRLKRVEKMLRPLAEAQLPEFKRSHEDRAAKSRQTDEDVRWPSFYQAMPTPSCISSQYSREARTDSNLTDVW